MPAPWATGTQVRIIGKLQGEDYNNVMHFATNTIVNDAPSLTPILVSLAQAVIACVIENLLEGATSDFRFLGVEVRPIYPNPGDPIFQAAPANSIGAGTPTSNSFTATLVHWRTGTGGRSGRGRSFWPPPGEGQMQDNAIGANAIDAFTDMVNCILGKFTGAGATEIWRFGILSTKKTGEPPVLPPFDQRFREVISGDVSPNQSMMESRKKGSGR